MNKPVRIFLADLVYDTVRTNYVVPLNIAFIAAFLQEKHGQEVEVSLFKYPSELERHMRSSPPDLLGLSHYSWNERLNRVFLSLAKTLNPDAVTVMGGPNIRVDADGIRTLLEENPLLDYYILFEGEESFSSLVSMLLEGKNEVPDGCAKLSCGKLEYRPQDQKKKSRELDYPSPYLSGLLDRFLSDPDFIPLFETNRGCPFGCTYCTWGISALSKVRKRPLQVVFDEFQYVAEKSAGQVNWIFCDANFGMLERDVEIARKVREIMDSRGFPIHVTLWHSKNTSSRNIEIAKIIKNSDGYIAIQSTDPAVLDAAGRGTIRFEHLVRQVEYYREQGLEVLTDILIGLPGETAQSHLKTLEDAFDLGFGKIQPYNIRMLPGSQYESAIDRKKFGVKTKFRPIFGAYGSYAGQNVFEIEESVRATSSMSESELEDFKLLHWLIYLCWNNGLCKSILRFGKMHGLNPATALDRLRNTDKPELNALFLKMRKQSMSEWFETREEAIEYYRDPLNFETMKKNFVKLNPLWIAQVFQDPRIVSALFSELAGIIESAIGEENSRNLLSELASIEGRMISSNLLQEAFTEEISASGEALALLLDDPSLAGQAVVKALIYRDPEEVALCNYHLNSGGKRDFSIQNLTRFVEMNGSALRNRIRLIR